MLFLRKNNLCFFQICVLDFPPRLNVDIAQQLHMRQTYRQAATNCSKENKCIDIGYVCLGSQCDALWVCIWLFLGQIFPQNRDVGGSGENKILLWSTSCSTGKDVNAHPACLDLKAQTETHFIENSHVKCQLCPPFKRHFEGLKIVNSGNSRSTSSQRVTMHCELVDSRLFPLSAYL